MGHGPFSGAHRGVPASQSSGPSPFSQRSLPNSAEWMAGAPADTGSSALQVGTDAPTVLCGHRSQPLADHTRKHSLPLLENAVVPSGSSVMVTGELPCVPSLRALELQGTRPHRPSREPRQGHGHVRRCRASAGPRVSCSETLGPTSSQVSSAGMSPGAQLRGKRSQPTSHVSWAGSGLGELAQ